MVIPDNIQAVIFDLDGTLVDSMWVWKQIDVDYLGKFGIDLPDDLQSSLDGMSFSETADYVKARFDIPDSIEKIKQDWIDMTFDYYRNHVDLKNGALEFLKGLKERKIKTGIATSNSVELLHTVLESLNIENYFDSVHVACEVPKGKPAPDIYLLVASDLKTDPANILVFEDIRQGIEAAHSAGMLACGIYDLTSHERGHFIEEISDYYINDFTELSFSADKE